MSLSDGTTTISHNFLILQQISKITWTSMYLLHQLNSYWHRLRHGTWSLDQ